MNIKIVKYDEKSNVEFVNTYDYIDNCNITFDEFLKENKIFRPISNVHIDITKQIARYILRSEKYIWYVPFSEFTLQEFEDTYHDDVLEISYGGGGIGAVDGDTLLKILGFIGGIESVYNISKKTYLFFRKKLSKERKLKFANELKYKDTYIIPHDLNVLIRSRKEWNFRYLKKALGNIDDYYLKMILYAAGYVSNHKGSYIYNFDLDKKNQIYLNKFSKWPHDIDH